MRRLFLFSLFVVSIALGVLFTHAGRYRDIFQTVCDLTDDHFYRADARLQDWVHRCRVRAASVGNFVDVDKLLLDIQDQLNEMSVSHFQIYSPEEDRRLWKGEGLDSGIRSRYVEDHLVVYRVLPGSAGAESDVRAGDEILHIEGTDQVTPWGAGHRAGKFTIQRGENTLDILVASKDMTPDFSPTLTEIDKHTAVVEIPSFRSDFFEREKWQQFVHAFDKYSHLIVDVRENAGGNFVAMLRALSTFECGGHHVGVLIQPRKSLPTKEAFEDNTSDDYQIQELDKFRALGLRTFSDYGCFKGKVTVLISSETASVAEIFAHSFFGRPNSRVWGQPTAGDVVLAVWYDMTLLGEGYSISIPEAVFLTRQKRELEGQGVWPKKELYYDLKDSLAGKDTWIERARE